MRLGIVAFVFQMPEDWCSRTQMLPTLQMWYSFAPTKVRQVLFATNLSIRNSIIAMAAEMELVLIADMHHSRDALRISFIRQSGVKVFIEQEVPALTRVVNGQTEHARMDLVFNLNGSITYLDVSIVAPFSCNPSLGFCCQHKTRTYGQESGENQI